MTSVFGDATLCNQLDAHLDNGLKERIKHSKAKKEKMLKAWINAACHLDKTCNSENKCHRELIEETFNKHQAKCQNTDNNALHNTSCCYNTSTLNTNSSTSTFTPLTLLLDTKHTLLNEHNSCTKFRKFYVSHKSCHCPNGFPSGKGYKTLSVADNLTMKKGTSTAPSTSSTKQAPKAVAATTSSSDNEPNIVAAVLPSASDCDLDSDENADISECDICSPIKSKHLVWDCQIHRLLTDFPVRAQALIDNGTHVVLIWLDLIDKLNLRKHCLHKPEVVDVTMNNEKKSSSKLYEYVNDTHCMGMNVKVWNTQNKDQVPQEKP